MILLKWSDVFLHIVNEVLWFNKLKIQSSECTSHKPLREQKK